MIVLVFHRRQAFEARHFDLVDVAITRDIAGEDHIALGSIEARVNVQMLYFHRRVAAVQCSRPVVAVATGVPEADHPAVVADS